MDGYKLAMSGADPLHVIDNFKGPMQTACGRTLVFYAELNSKTLAGICPECRAKVEQWERQDGGPIMWKTIKVKDLELTKADGEAIAFQIGETGDMHFIQPGETGYDELNKLFGQDQTDAEDEEGQTLLNHLFAFAEKEAAISGRVMVMENLLRYAVSKLPETEQKIAEEIMHLIGVGPIVAPENAENDYEGNQGETTNPYTGAEDDDELPPGW